LGDYGALFALKFPKPSLCADQVIRIGDDTEIGSIEPRIRAGSWLALDPMPLKQDVLHQSTNRGWAQPLYALRRGVDTMLGHLDWDGTKLASLTQHASRNESVHCAQDEIQNLRACLWGPSSRLKSVLL
jgi:hypothetical protein